MLIIYDFVLVYVMNRKRCLICNGVSGELKMVTEAGLKSVCEASLERRDNLHTRHDAKEQIGRAHV